MNIIISKYAPTEIYQAIKELNPQQVNVPGTLWINADDGRNLAVICAFDPGFVVNFGLIQSTIAQIRNITEHIYVVTDCNYAHQLLSLQELGAFTAIIDSLEDLPKLIKFISNPKRRTEKIVHPPCRSLRMFTPGEQLLLTIEGIGERKVRDLLNWFGPVAWVLAALTQYETTDLDFIKKKDIDSFRKDIQIDDNMILAVIMKEDKE